jgi:autotransporter family porin
VLGATPSHFDTLPVGASLPSDAQCAAWVRAVAAPPEVKGVNRVPNSVVGEPLAGATGLLARVDGSFTGTTEQILRWTACKWGVDEDIVKAQAAVEGWWRMDTKGDWGTDATQCAPGHGPGLDGAPGSCPESFGLLQVRYPYNQIAFPLAIASTALNTDYAYAQWRDCYEGNVTWLNSVDHGTPYAAGDAWGCLGVWYSGRWHTSAADGYITKVRDYLNQRIWTMADFRQP